jgi:hypothetical protein
VNLVKARGACSHHNLGLRGAFRGYDCDGVQGCGGDVETEIYVGQKKQQSPLGQEQPAMGERRP